VETNLGTGTDPRAGQQFLFDDQEACEGAADRFKLKGVGAATFSRVAKIGL